MTIPKSEKKDLFFEAMAFAARVHQGQFRKDKKTPYVSHVYGVAMTLCCNFGVKDPNMLAAAVLHDTLEDTETRFCDLEKRFGRCVALWVELLSKDMKKSKSEREWLYCRQLEKSPLPVKLIKLADIYDNLRASRTRGRADFKNFLPKAEVYFRLISKDKSSCLTKPLYLVRRLMK